MNNAEQIFRLDTRSWFSRLHPDTRLLITLVVVLVPLAALAFGGAS